MIDLPVIAAAAATCLAGVVSPGPNFLAVSHRATTSASREALGMAIGIALVNVLWSALALFGMGMVIARLPGGLSALGYAGAAYLVWIGSRQLVHSRRAAFDPMNSRARTSSGRAILQGMGTNLSNPKSMVFYASVFTGAVPAGTSPPTLLVLVAVVGLLAFGWYGSLALALSRPRIAKAFESRRKMVERCCGVLLVAVGLRQAIGS